MKRLFIFMLSSALVCVALATWAAPSLLGWYFRPPSGGVVMMQGDEAVRWGISRLIETQLISLAVGAAIGLALGIATRRKRAPEAPPAPAAPR